MGPGEMSKRYKAAEHSDGLQSCKVLVVSRSSDALQDFADLYRSLLGQTFQAWKWLICCSGVEEQPLNPAFLQAVAEDKRVLIKGGADCTVANEIWASPEYIVLADAAIEFDPTFIEKGIWCLESNPEFAFCNSFGVVPGVGGGAIQQSLSEGKYYLENPHAKVRGILVRKSVILQVFDQVGLLPDGREPTSLLSRLADAGFWGFTIAEFLQTCKSLPLQEGVDAALSMSLKPVPSPQRRYPSAYETLPEGVSFGNPLEFNARGRRVMFLLPWMVEGGADRVNIDLIHGLVSGGADVTVCATLEADHRWLDRFKELTPDIFILPNILSLSDFPRFLLYLIASRNIDTVLVAGSTLGYQLLPYLRTEAPKTTFVDLSHTEEMHWLNGGHPRFGVGYQDALDMNVVSTGHLAKWMAERNADSTKIRVMYTGIKSHPVSLSQAQRTETQRALGLDEHALTIIFAGRMCNQKRPLKLAEILAALKQTGIRFNALIIGDGELRPAFEALIGQHELGANVHVLGAKSHAEWLSLLAISDVLLMPSEYEGISVALLESMAAGVVPVVADVGGQDELVGQDTGYLIPHGEDEVNHYVSVLLTLSNDAVMREQKAQACRQLIETHYTAAATNRQWLQILDEAQANRERSTQPFLPAGLARELATTAVENRRVTTYLDYLYSTHCLTNEAQTVVSIEDGISRLLLAKLRQYRLFKYLLERPVIKRIMQKLKALIS
ncbi:D-inositol-3-phosphate glycosyltransferase [Pseudomonas fluorescens]|uniref:D-inositol-3-phosphate glycosyltransferase n=2 Tax=Pseudomonas fluorescens TaxID=294 RepID=A0ABD7VBN9_PSEFL|nr:D-inositol-3-phosphate glycosyltransferase [Pseudomonas fluorescens]